jgi:hypothetical protein
MKRKLVILLAAAMIFLFQFSGHAAVIFTDDFSTQKGWGNELGNWTIEEGAYYATASGNNPPTYSSAPTVALTNFTVEFDVNNASDGGTWLRSSYNSYNNTSGLLMVIGGSGGRYNGIYFHNFLNGSYSEAFGFTDIQGLQRNNEHFKIDVLGDTYSIYLNRGTTPICTITDSKFSSGLVAFYGFSPLTVSSFDNIIISTVPIPGAILLFAPGLAGIATIRRRLKK